MNLVVTVDENWAIGKQGEKLVQIPADQRYFQKLTSGKVVVMGRKTQQALPQGIPYHFCNNLIMTRNDSYTVKGAEIIHSYEDLLKWLEHNKEDASNVYICGGKSIYEEFLPFCDTAYVTYVEKTYDANECILCLDEEEKWVMDEESDEQTYFDMTYYFRKYRRL